MGQTWLGRCGDAPVTFQSDTRKVRRKEKRGRGGGKREEEGPSELTCSVVTTRMRASTCDPGVLFGVVQVGGGGDLACPCLDADASVWRESIARYLRESAAWTLLDHGPVEAGHRGPPPLDDNNNINNNNNNENNNNTNNTKNNDNNGSSSNK